MCSCVTWRAFLCGSEQNSRVATRLPGPAGPREAVEDLTVDARPLSKNNSNPDRMSVVTGARRGSLIHPDVLLLGHMPKNWEKNG